MELSKLSKIILLQSQGFMASNITSHATWKRDPWKKCNGWKICPIHWKWKLNFGLENFVPETCFQTQQELNESKTRGLETMVSHSTWRQWWVYWSGNHFTSPKSDIWHKIDITILPRNLDETIKNEIL